MLSFKHGALRTALETSVADGQLGNLSISLAIMENWRGRRLTLLANTQYVGRQPPPCCLIGSMNLPRHYFEVEKHHAENGVVGSVLDFWC
jgi:hypothetical protein